MATGITLTGTWLPSDSDVGGFRLLPFDVPPGISRLGVEYRVESVSSSPTGAPPHTPQLDIGLFDPGGADFLDAPGFRGWSGVFRSGFYVSEHSSTPGYLRGPIQAGTWQVLISADGAMLGPGLSYTIEVSFTEGPPGVAVPYTPYEPGALSNRQGWYKGNLHSHTYYSDGHDSIEAVADEYLRLGLDFGALTEHNILNPDLAKGHRPGFLWLPSEEVTTYRGHLNVWGLSDWLDFRCEDEQALQAVIDAAHAQGAITSINHPKDDGPPWGFDLYTADCMEVWQAPWFLGNYQSLAVLEGLLHEGKRIVAVGGSDLHRVGTPDNPYAYNMDNPTTWVRASQLSIAAILEGISRGHVFVSSNAQGPRLFLTAEGGHAPAEMGDMVFVAEGDGLVVRAEVYGAEGYLLRLLTHDGVVHVSPVLSEHTRVEYLWSTAGREAGSGPAYIRAEVMRDMGPDVDVEEEPSALWLEAMTNPIYARPVERPAGAFEARAQAEVAVGGSLSPAGPPRAPRLVDRRHR